jgi:hypothetical protein
MTAALTVGAPGRSLPPQWVVVAAGVAIAAAVGGAVAWVPMLAVAPLAAIGAVLLLVSGQFRTIFVVFGGLATLQSSQELDPIKIGYLLGVGIALAAAIANLPRLETTSSYSLLLLYLRLSFFFFFLVALSFGVAIAHGTPVTAWLRDAAPYFLFASIPVFALDVRSSASRKSLTIMFVVAGILAAMSFAVEWLDRRHLADVPLNRVVLPSFLLPAAMFSYAVSEALHGKSNRIGWALLGAFIISLSFVTGTRSTFVVLMVLPVIAFAGKKSLLRASLRLVLFGGVAILLVLLFTQSVARLTGTDVGRLTDRIASTGQLIREPGTDPSYQERAAQTSAAWRTFLSEPLLGAGPGHAFEWTSQSGEPRAGFNVDSPLAIPAKFGLVGITVLAALAFALVSLLRRFGEQYDPTVPQLALMGYVAVTLAWMLLGSPFEDKGFSFGLLFLLALSLPREQ